MNLKQTYAPVLLFFLILAFPSFYFVYKFADPIDVGHDFFQYYRLYYNWDWSNVNAPFNMRLISSAFIYLFHKTGFYYETVATFDKYMAYGFDKSVFFSAVFFNYVCVASTATLIFITVKQKIKEPLIPLLAGTVFLLGSGIQLHQMMPCADAFSTFLFALAFYFYQKQSHVIWLVLILSILQREYILLAFMIIGGIDWLQKSNAIALKTTIVSILGFAVYFSLRRTLFYTPALSFQTSPAALMQAFVSDMPSPGPYLRQLILTLNLFIMYTAIVAYKKYNRLEIIGNGLLKINLLLLQIILISFAASLGTNTGRYFFIAAPLLVYYLAVESNILFQRQQPG